MSEITPIFGGDNAVAHSSRVRAWRVLLVYRRYASGFVYYPWMLSRAGLVVDVVATEKHPVRRSRCVHRFYAAASTDESFRDVVGARLASGGYALLLMVDEPSRNLFYSGPIDPVVEPFLPIPRDCDLSEALADKEKFHVWCERHGVPTPQTRAVSSVAEAAAFASEWKYPVVLKGAVGAGGKAVRICRDRGELDAAFRLLSEAGGHVLAQRFISGAIGSTSFVAYRGKVGSWVASEKRIALANGLGPSAVRRLRTDPEIGRIVAKIASAGKITGITGFDWMEASPGEFLVIDPHFGRCTPPAAISHFAGVDVGQAVRDLLEENGRQQTPANEGLVVAMFPQFLELVLQGRLGTLLARANPFSRGVRYHFGPAEEKTMTAYLAADYIASAARVGLGALRRKLTPKAEPRSVMPAAAGATDGTVRKPADALKLA